MLLIFNIFFFCFILALFMNSLASLISSKSLENQEKSSPFECGFEPLSSSRMPFSLRFFLITIIFLIFDVEIAFILPMIFNFKKSNMLSWIIISFIMIMILIIGIIHEWNEGILKWY